MTVPTLRPDQLGEILLKGPKVFAGYSERSDATAAAFTDGWFKTGDVGRLDVDGYLYIEDRRKDMIISGGENIATPEIERVLYQHPAVLEAAVIGVPDSRWGEVPRAIVVLRPGESTSGEDLIAFCATQLANSRSRGLLSSSNPSENAVRKGVETRAPSASTSHVLGFAQRPSGCLTTGPVYAVLSRLCLPTARRAPERRHRSQHHTHEPAA